MGRSVFATSASLMHRALYPGVQEGDVAFQCFTLEGALKGLRKEADLDKFVNLLEYFGIQNPKYQVVQGKGSVRVAVLSVALANEVVDKRKVLAYRLGIAPELLDNWPSEAIEAALGRSSESVAAPVPKIMVILLADIVSEVTITTRSPEEIGALAFTELAKS